MVIKFPMIFSEGVVSVAMSCSFVYPSPKNEFAHLRAKYLLMLSTDEVSVKSHHEQQFRGMPLTPAQMSVSCFVATVTYLSSGVKPTKCNNELLIPFIDCRSKPKYFGSEMRRYSSHKTTYRKSSCPPHSGH